MITKEDIVAALRLAGVKRGMTVFSHHNIAFFGRVEGASNLEALITIVLDAFQAVLGPSGTLVLPVFTYSFGADKSEKVFDLQHSLSTTSGMGNYLLRMEAGVRSADPMLSVVAIGGDARSLTQDIGLVCFGADSIWARLHAADAVICNLNFDSGSTFLHWVERELGVAYRTDIPMAGKIIDHGSSRNSEILYTGRSLDDKLALPRFESYHQASVAAGISSIVPLGRGQIVLQTCRSARSFLTSLYSENPQVLTARNAHIG